MMNRLQVYPPGVVFAGAFQLSWITNNPYSFYLEYWEQEE
jgi:hypothetical protein